MGSSESGEVADGCVGSIVWVRRRNGSWWPGKILGQEELSLSHVTSPRAGTPVKLLGREDASVDMILQKEMQLLSPKFKWLLVYDPCCQGPFMNHLDNHLGKKAILRRV